MTYVQSPVLHMRAECLPCKFSCQPVSRRSVECPTVRILYPVSPVQPRNHVRPSPTGSAVSVLNVYPLISFDFGVERPAFGCISVVRVTRRRPEHAIGRSVPKRKGGSSRRLPARSLGRPTSAGLLLSWNNWWPLSAVHGSCLNSGGPSA